MIWTVMVLAFMSALALCLAAGAVVYAPRLKRAAAMKNRLAQISPPEIMVQANLNRLLKDNSLSTIPLLHRMLSKFPKRSDVQKLLYQAGKPFNLGTLVLLCSVLGTLGVLVGAMKASWSLGVVMAPGLASVPFLWLRVMAGKRLKAFDEQFPDAVDMIARSLRAGHSFGSTLKMVAEEAEDPVAGEFNRTFEDYSFGKGMAEALAGLAERVDLPDVKFLVTAVTLQRETGGNLTEILDNIGHIIRERFRLMRQVRALSAEGRLSGYILSLMAPGLMAVLHLVSPKYLELLFTHPMGQTMLVVGAVFQVMGMLVIKKLTSLKI